MKKSFFLLLATTILIGCSTNKDPISVITSMSSEKESFSQSIGETSVSVPSSEQDTSSIVSVNDPSSSVNNSLSDSYISYETPSSSTEEPSSNHTSVGEPSSNHTSLDEPSSNNSSISEPSSNNPSVPEPNSNYTSVDAPSSNNSSISEPSSNNSSVSEPSSNYTSIDTPSSSSSNNSSIDEPSSSIIGGDSNNLSSSNEPSSSVPVLSELSKPVLQLDAKTGVVTWNENQDATHYNIIINDSEVTATTLNIITLKDKECLSVQAVNSNYDVYSLWSDAVTYYNTSDIIVPLQKEVRVYFHGTNYAPVTMTSGNCITKPNDPIKEWYTFDNWYADPYHEEVFDFSKPIKETTIIYASFIPTKMTDNVYFYVKGNDKLSSDYQQYYGTDTWKFIPLFKNDLQTNFIEYYATVTVNGASETDPAEFVVTDGVASSAGRNYWKNNGLNFSIVSDGVYQIYFSCEHEYTAKIHALVMKAVINEEKMALKYVNSLVTPVVTIDEENNVARWSEVEGAQGYEVILNNLASKKITNNYVSLEKRTHITVRAYNDNSFSNWSIPKANIETVYETEPVPTHAYVYFLDSGLPSLKVALNTTVNKPNDPSSDKATFDGWYLDTSYQNQAEFPYLVTKNTVFYPKWTYAEDIYNKDYYVLTDVNGNVVDGLKWNVGNYDFYEYQTATIILSGNAEYYIQTLDKSKSWGPYTVHDTGSYRIFFSEEHLWGVGTGKERNIYIQSMISDIYFTKPKSSEWSGSWSSDTVKAYLWNSATEAYKVAWPGENMEYVTTNNYGQKIYRIKVDLGLYDMVIFSCGSVQTNDISLSEAYSGLGFYISGQSYGKYSCLTYDYK